jgi:hypothetical protein
VIVEVKSGLLLDPAAIPQTLNYVLCVLLCLLWPPPFGPWSATATFHAHPQDPNFRRRPVGHSQRAR